LVKYTQNFIQHPAVKLNSICGGNYYASSVWLSTQQVRYLRKKWEYNEVVHQLFIDFRKALEDPGVDGRIILRWIFRKWDGGHGLD
jgi:hypothetical protein